MGDDAPLGDSPGARPAAPRSTRATALLAAPSRALLTPAEMLSSSESGSRTSLLDPAGCSSLTASQQVA
jgi:hypothetical protein